MNPLNDFKIAIVDFTGLAKDALHIYVALGVFIAACLIFRWRALEWKPVLLVLAVAICGEIFDMRHNALRENDPFVLASLHDVWNTLLVPLIIFAAARYSRIFEKPKPPKAEAVVSGNEPEM
ncbi:hypothetical protein GCM10023115_16000 [Pontixanthobacter gangjinensis]|uniref:VanZ-like domain-containing protein n=1 Tax=Pontixanthobacter gangjinensis TaxID=1028742 RepID=A0A6I4SM96_9SPHN|nr:hypothetical protein [Pontixanthobacter gangjinensis]MXO56843.1 hypothetical protein [Pontixanthobacter gangjinensis]